MPIVRFVSLPSCSVSQVSRRVLSTRSATMSMAVSRSRGCQSFACGGR